MTEDKNKYILSINGMSKSFGRNKVLKGINMNVKPGTIMGLMGENGAGKSTMMKCLFQKAWNHSKPDTAYEEDVCISETDV